jgi:hypothetical protein
MWFLFGHPDYICGNSQRALTVLSGGEFESRACPQNHRQQAFQPCELPVCATAA